MDKCSQHQLEQLRPDERLAHTVATRQAERGDRTGPNIVGALLLTIERMAHELGHAHWGGLECDNPDWPE
jgi:hypothetical protein